MSRRSLSLVAVVTVALAGLVGIAGTETASAASGSPIGAFDTASASFDGNVGLYGWAAVPNAAPGVTVAVQVSLGPKVYNFAITGRSRPDVAAAVPGVGPSTGWVTAFSPDDLVNNYPHGTTACAVAVALPSGLRTPLGCKNIVISGDSPFNPVGVLDSAVASPSLVRLRGWAGDPDGTPTTQLRVYFDGNLVANETAALPRPDVKAALPALSTTTGFDISLASLPGTHFICVYAQNSGRQGLQNSTVGCVTRFVPGIQPPGPHDPRGNLESVFQSGNGPPSTFDPIYTASGWAYDPDTTGPINVVIRTLAVPADPFVPPSVGNLTTGVARPDVQAAFPGAGPNAGFSAPGATATFSVRAYYICAYATNTGPGADRLIGCVAGHP